MTATQSVYLQLQKVARDRKRPADEIFTLYGLERFLARLAATPYADGFCLKGGVLLSAHALRTAEPNSDRSVLWWPAMVRSGKRNGLHGAEN